MATINIGNLAFTHKGDYDGSTAYVKNDVVYYSSTGSAYIAKQSTTGNLPTSTAHWNIFSAGSGGIWNAGLSLGSAGQVVKVNSGASALEFGTISSDWVKLGRTDLTSTASVSFQDVFSADYDIYKVFVNGVASSSSNQNLYFRWLTSGSTEDSTANYNGMHDITYREDSNNNRSQASDAYTGASQYRITGWGAIGDSGTWSGMNNWELTLYDPYHNHKSTSAKGGNIVFVSGYMYHNSYQISLRGNLWHNTTNTAYSGFKLFLESTTNFQALGTVSVYGIKA